MAIQYSNEHVLQEQLGFKVDYNPASKEARDAVLAVRPGWV
mgnify:CR=1 FL=1